MSEHGGTHYVRELIRGHADPVNTAIRIACDQRDQREVTAAVECPHELCRAPVGTPCFGPDARTSHPERDIAHSRARALARAMTHGVLS